MAEPERTPKDLGEEPDRPQCPVCGKQVAHMGALTGHMKSHEKGGVKLPAPSKAPRKSQDGRSHEFTDAELERSIAGNYGLIGAGVEMVGMARGNARLRLGASAVVQLSDDAAKAWVTLASYSPTIRRGLELASKGGIAGAVVNVVLVHVAMVAYVRAEGEVSSMPPFLRFGLKAGGQVSSAMDGFDLGSMMNMAEQFASTMTPEQRDMMAGAMGGAVHNDNDGETS